MATSESEDTIMIPAWIDGVLQPVEKLAAHKRALRHRAVSVFVVTGDRLLLQRRAMGKYHTPGLWANTCCTHPFWDERPEDCATRRLNEELGITGLTLTYRGQIEYRAKVGAGLIEHELVDVYRAKVGAEIAMHPNPAEVMETEWIGLDDLAAELATNETRFVPWLKIYIQDHRQQIFGA